MAVNAETFEAAALDYVGLTVEVVSAYVSKNPVPSADMAELIASTHAALAGLGRSGTLKARPAEKQTPLQIRKSVTPDALISFIDGRPYKMLKSHLTRNGLTIEQYRKRFGLPWDYPTTATNYSALRSEFARSNGLGHLRKKVAPKAAAPAETISDKPKRAGRPRKAKEAAEA